MTRRTERCDYRCEHDVVIDKPTGERCQNEATHMIRWADGRYSLGCVQHLDIDPAASVQPVSVIKIQDVRW